MKKLFLAFFTLSLVTFSSCDVLEQVNEYNRFIQCDFSLVNIKVLEIGGIDISSLGDKGDLGIKDMMTITNMLYSGDFPAKMSVNLKAANKNPKKAAIAGMEWQLLMKGKNMLSGMVEKEIAVAPYGSTDFPVILNVDLFKLLKSKPLPQIMVFAFGNNQYEQLEKLGVEIKIKPYYHTGSGIKKYPGYLTIRP